MSGGAATFDVSGYPRKLPAEAQRKLGELNELNTQHEMLEEQVRGKSPCGASSGGAACSALRRRGGRQRRRRSSPAGRCQRFGGGDPIRGSRG